MTDAEIITRLAQGEDSRTQFKYGPIGIAHLAEELVAFANAQGCVMTKGDIRPTKGDIGKTKGDIQAAKGDIGKRKGDIRESKRDIGAYRFVWRCGA